MEDIGHAFASGLGQVLPAGIILLVALAMFLKWGRWLFPTMHAASNNEHTDRPVPDLDRGVLDSYREQLLTRIKQDRNSDFHRLVVEVDKEREPERSAIHDTKEACRRIEGILSQVEPRDMARDSHGAIGRIEKAQTESISQLSILVAHQVRVAEVLERIEVQLTREHDRLTAHMVEDAAVNKELAAALASLRAARAKR